LNAIKINALSFHPHLMHFEDESFLATNGLVIETKLTTTKNTLRQLIIKQHN